MEDRTSPATAGIPLGANRKRSFALRGSPHRSQQPLPPTDIVPSIKFSSNLTVNAYQFEAHGFVKPDTRLIWQRNAGKSSVIPQACGCREQTGIKGARYAASLRARRHIDCHVDRCPVCRAGPVFGGVGVTDNSRIHFGHEVGIVRHYGGYAPFNFHDVGRHLLKRDRRVGYIRCGNCLNCRCVLHDDLTNNHVFTVSG